MYRRERDSGPSHPALLSVLVSGTAHSTCLVQHGPWE